MPPSSSSIEARAVRPDLRSHPDVSAICERLDGLPLALELAASRVKVLDPSLLLERLARSLPLLTGGTRDAPERQQTLRATIGGATPSWRSRCSERFHRLAVFPSSFSLEAAESRRPNGHRPDHRTRRLEPLEADRREPVPHARDDSRVSAASGSRGVPSGAKCATGIWGFSSSWSSGPSRS